MAYKSKFLHFKTKASYNAERAKTTTGTEERKVFDAYISFIDEGPMICTWGKEYKCDISASEVEALVNAGKISPATVAPLIAGTAAVGTSTKYAREDHRHPEQVNITGNAATATTATNLASAPSFINNGNTIKITVGNKTSTEFTIPYASKTSSAETLMYGRNIFLDGDVTGSTTKSFNGSKNVTINTTISTINAEKLTGIINVDRLPEIPIEKLPAGALERMFVVESQTAAIDAVKAGTIQEGDVVQIGNGGLMYFCIDDAATTFENAFKEFTAGSATSVPWSGVTGKPSTFTPSAHTQSYTTLTGSTTTANQAIVSNGTANGWTLKTLGSLAFSSATIPTKTSQLTNDSGFLTSVPAQSWASITGKPTFATVATSGSYNDLSNKPTIPSLSGYATQSWVTSQGYLTSIPVATSSAYGGIQIGYTTSGKNYAVQLSNGKAYVNVPWTDTNTTYTSGTNISISGTTINCTYSYSLPTATSSVLGGVKIGSNITVSSGTISLSKANITSALGYTPANTAIEFQINVADNTPIGGASYIFNGSTNVTLDLYAYGGNSAGDESTASDDSFGLVWFNGDSDYVLCGGGYWKAISLMQISNLSLHSNQVRGGYAYNGGSTISSVSLDRVNPDAVVATSTKITSFPSDCKVMDGIADLSAPSGGKYVYCFTYIGGVVYVNGAVYA